MAEQELVAEGLTPSSSPLDEPSKRPEQMQSDEAIDEIFPGERSTFTLSPATGIRFSACTLQ